MFAVARIVVIYYLLAVAAAAAALLGNDEFVVDPVHLIPTTYQKWAHHHFVWLKNGDGNQANITTMIEEYEKHGIPVGAVNIDSTW